MAEKLDKNSMDCRGSLFLSSFMSWLLSRSKLLSSVKLFSLVLRFWVRNEIARAFLLASVVLSLWEVCCCCCCCCCCSLLGDEVCELLTRLDGDNEELDKEEEEEEDCDVSSLALFLLLREGDEVGDCCSCCWLVRVFRKCILNKIKFL